MSTACILCGTDPARGYATSGDHRLCHGDDQTISCYERYTVYGIPAAGVDEPLRVLPRCGGCGMRPHRIDDVVYMVMEDRRDAGLPAYSLLSQSEREQICDDWVRAEEGTFDPSTGAFLCTPCYIRLGEPSVDARAGRWTATPSALRALRAHAEADVR